MDNFIIIPFTTQEYKSLIDFCKALDYDVIKWAKTTLLDAAKEQHDDESFQYLIN